jgi:hypothetical protein
VQECKSDAYSAQYYIRVASNQFLRDEAIHGEDGQPSVRGLNGGDPIEPHLKTKPHSKTEITELIKNPLRQELSPKRDSKPNSNDKTPVSSGPSFKVTYFGFIATLVGLLLM